MNFFRFYAVKVCGDGQTVLCLEHVFLCEQQNLLFSGFTLPGSKEANWQ